MTFPAEKLDCIPNPVNFTQDWLLTASRLVASAPALREGTELTVCRAHRAPSPRYRETFPHKIILWDLLELPLPSTDHKCHPAWREHVIGTPETGLGAFQCFGIVILIWLL